MSNTSATGGPLVPTSSTGFPGGLSFEDFIQSVLVGVTGLNGTLVRPKFQINPPKQPDITINWLAFSIMISTPGTNAYVNLDANDSNVLQRNEDVEVQLSFYGPNAMANASLLQDAFQIQQNNEALRSANMGFKGVGPAVRGPDLVNERWVERYEISLFLTRRVKRVYPVLFFTSASGTIHTEIEGGEHEQDFQVEEIV